jgi:hypothetical protein
MIIALVTSVTIPRSLKAQPPMSGKLLIQTTYLIEWPEKGKKTELDSLLKIFKTIYSKIPIVSNVQIAEHEWGSDSRQIVMQYEVKSMTDLDALDAASDKAFADAYPDKELRKKFGHALGGYLHGKHSDEIYHLLE